MAGRARSCRRRADHDEPPRRLGRDGEAGDGGRDIYRDGFSAATYAEELKAPDLELNVLVGIMDVTDQVNAKVTGEMDDAEAAQARREAHGRDRVEVAGEDGAAVRRGHALPGRAVSPLPYKKYTDVRLVFAPEFDIAFFGGDEDNFEYPRYDLDVCFFRAYEDDKPAQVEHYLKWSENGSSEGDLIFVAGHPGRTNRLNTVASLEYLRDLALPGRSTCCTTWRRF